MGTASGIQVAIEQDQSGPEARYADLHRHLESGACDEKTWADLTKVCLDLGKEDEAVEAYHKLVSFGPRTRLHALLVEKGLLDKDDPPPEPEASYVTDEDMQPTPSEGVSDGIQFLVRGRVPLVAMVGMIAFGILLAIGGILHSLVGIVIVTIVILPIAVALYGVVAAFSARILMASLSGLDDPPDLPTRNEVIGESKRGALFLLGAATMLLLPGILVHWLLPVPVISALLVVLGWSLLPLVFSIRQLTRGWRESGPATWWQVSRRANPRILLATVVNLALFAPAALTMHGALDQPVYLVACFAGLLSVVPLLVSARMLAQIFYYERKNLRDLLDLERVSQR